MVIKKYELLIILLFLCILKNAMKIPRYLQIDALIQKEKKLGFYNNVDSQDLMKLGSKPCIRVRRIFNKTNSSCTETCLSVGVYARYGNNFVSFLTAIGIARGIGMNRIVISPNFLFINKSFKFDDISVDIENNDENNCFHNDFYYIPKAMQPLISQHIRKIPSEFLQMYLKKFPKVDIPDNSLVVHIRSSNIFKIRPHWKYGQPPCNYYLDVINMKKWNKVILIAEDNKNPCVNIVAPRTEGYVQRSFIEDFAYLLYAKNLVISRSTLTNAIVTLSPVITNLYSYNHSRFFDVNFMNCIPTDKYYSDVIKRWANSRFQREMLINSDSCKNWETFPKIIERQIRTNLWDID